MECQKCGGQMKKFKYMEISDIEDFLTLDFVPAPKRGYKKWLNTLDSNDLVKTEFIRKEFGKVKVKYYIRLVDKKIRTGIRLKRLTKTFKFDTGMISYGEDSNTSIYTSYKIYPIQDFENELIRDYCSSTDIFDIDKLNKLLTEEILRNNAM
jgi:hypothetical protein